MVQHTAIGMGTAVRGREALDDSHPVLTDGPGGELEIPTLESYFEKRTPKTSHPVLTEGREFSGPAFVVVVIRLKSAVKNAQSCSASTFAHLCENAAGEEDGGRRRRGRGRGRGRGGRWDEE